MERKLALMIATWFGIGLIPPIFFRGMAGTYGSLAALPLAYIASFRIYFYLATILILFLLGLWSIPISERELGPKIDWKGKTRSRDQNQIVIDEVLGILIACLPLLWIHGNFLPAILTAFLAFRFFAIVKIQPAKYFDKLKNPAGIMLDDTVAGIYAAWLTASIFT